MCTTRNSIVAALALGITAAASAATIDLKFTENELGGAFQYFTNVFGYELGTATTANPGHWREISLTSTPNSGGWDYQLVLDFSGYCLDCLNPSGSISLIIDNFADSFTLTSYTANRGTHSFTGSAMSWSGTVNEIKGNIFNPDPYITLSWNVEAIPAPGAFALLGLAGVCGVSRRRRC